MGGRRLALAPSSVEDRAQVRCVPGSTSVENAFCWRGTAFFLTASWDKDSGFLGDLSRDRRRTEGMRRRWDRRSKFGAPGLIMMHAAKGNTLRSNVYCTRWGWCELLGDTGWTFENSAAVGRAYSCPLALDGISVSATLSNVGPRGPA